MYLCNMVKKRTAKSKRKQKCVGELEGHFLEKENIW